MKHFAYIIFILMLSATGVAAQETVDTVLDSVAVTGADSALVSELTPSLLSRPGGILNEGYVAHDLDVIRTHLRERGWWKADVTAAADTLAGNRATLEFMVEAGSPALFGLVRTNAGDDAPVTATGPDDRHYGEPYSRAVIEREIAELVAAMTAEGYPAASVTPSLTASGDTVHTTLTAIPGTRAMIDSIAIAGLTRTKDHVIRRELAPLAGQPAGLETVARCSDIIGALTFVRTDGDPRIVYAGGRAILAVRLTEGSQGTFDGVLGYQPDDEGDSGNLVGKIDLGFDNLLGTGREAAFRWENLGEDTEDLELGYTEPWLFGRPYSATASFLQEERELLDYVRTVMTGGIDRDFGRLTLGATLRYEKVSADSTDSYSGSGIEGGAAWTALDNRRNPTSGIRYALSWATLSKKYRFAGRDDTRIERLEIDVDHYVPTWKRQTLAVFLRYRNVDIPREHLSLSDRYWIGGATTIRGHIESQYPAIKALWTTAEYRFLTGESSRVFLFMDTGWLVNRTETGGSWDKTTTNVTGYGFGLRVSSRAGVLGFDYGLAKGDSPGDGKLHVSMRTEF